MKLDELADEYFEANPSIVLDETQNRAEALAAVRQYAAYGDIRSLSLADTQLEAPGAGGTYPETPDPAPDWRQAYPIKDLTLIKGDTEISTGEWSIIKPLYLLYVERSRAYLLEATRNQGLDVFGRSVSEIQSEIERMESEILPAKAFQHDVYEV